MAKWIVPIILYFQYSAYMDPQHGGHWAFMQPDKGQTLRVTRFDFSRPSEVTIVYSFGLKTAQRATLKQSPGFDSEPRRIRGYVLQGAYHNTESGLYELYYLSPDRRSLLERLFSGPGRQVACVYFSSRPAYNPFRDTLFAQVLTDTVRLTPRSAH